MTGNKIVFSFISLLVTGLWSCSSEDLWEPSGTGTDGFISLNVGVESSPAHRAVTRGSASDPYYAMQAGTQVRLRVDGIWKRKSPTVPVSQKTTCNTVAALSESSVNTLSFTDSEMLYWDDYGTGDPDNADSRAAGLRVLGVAVDGKDAAPAVVDDAAWESLAWDVVTDGGDVLSGDIIVSNNLTAYKFAQRNDDEAKRMVFVHPLSKITVNLKAGEGFTSGTVGATTFKFENDPTVTLTNATTLDAIADPQNDYALTKGTVSITDATAVSDGTKSTVIAGTTSTSDAGITVIKQAVVYPGTQLGADDDAVIAVVNADGNIYYIKAKEIHDAITAKGGHTDFRTLAGYNYIINITVNKTGIRLTATVTRWTSVDSDEVHPVINVNTHVGDDGGDKPSSEFNKFAFWRSESIGTDYQHEATPAVGIDGTTDWSATTTLYWTHHNQHYHFRGIFPVGTVVKTSGGRQVVEVANGPYDAATFPSNFVMGMPEFSADDYMCDNEDHEHVDMRTAGICARTSAINLNFRYMMSRVEVNLSSSAVGAKDYVDLSDCKVELVNAGTDGNVLLSDRSAQVTTDAQTYALHGVSGSKVHYDDIIVPQTLANTDSSNKVRFKITVFNGIMTDYDVYYADVAPIKVKASGASVSAPVDAWESGVHYVYNLKITKTEIKATASLTDWKTVEASEDVWF